MPPLTEQSQSHQGNIMIVDDNPANLKLLEDMLRQHGYEIRSFPRGRLALAAARQEPPDLILLDINMPEMNGYEVCEQLKSAQELSDIPVIFLSALNESHDKVKAFRSGAVDYVSKPFQFEEVHARVETHLKLHELQRTLKLQNDRLEAAVAARTHELAKANEQLTVLDRSKNEFLNLISHELRTPLNGLLGASEVILEEMPSTEENEELRELFQRSRRRILSIVDDALLLTEIDVSGKHFKSAQISLHAALSQAIERTLEFAQSHRVAFDVPRVAIDLVVQGDKALLVRTFHALLETAVKFSEPDETVRLAQEAGCDSLRLIIDSTGKTIPGPALPRFFDLFAIEESSTPGRDLGLGPALASRILSLFGASVSVTNRVPSGIRLTISLKRC
jgi:two-component system sensor histidine kinase/response regulator